MLFYTINNLESTMSKIITRLKIVINFISNVLLPRPLLEKIKWAFAPDQSLVILIGYWYLITLSLIVQYFLNNNITAKMSSTAKYSCWLLYTRKSYYLFRERFDGGKNFDLKMIIMKM